MTKLDFPENLFDERIMRKSDVDDTQADFVGRPNPDYDPDYIPPDDSIPF